MYVGFNQKPKVFEYAWGRAIRDPAVRHALEYAVDVPAICESLLRTPCKRMSTLITPSKDRSGFAPYPYDPDRAEHLLDASGYPRGKDGVRFLLTLQVLRGRYLKDSNVAFAVDQCLLDVGVSTDVQVLDYSSVFAAPCAPARRRTNLPAWHEGRDLESALRYVGPGLGRLRRELYQLE